MERNRDIEQYIHAHIDPEDELLKALDRETHFKVVNYRMLSGHLQGLFLTFLSKLIKPRVILEIGTLTGYSAICLAKGLESGGKLFTIEIDDELSEISARYIKEAGLEDRIVPFTGNALEIIPVLDETFDLVMIDGHKAEYVSYYNLVFDKVRSGGLIIADNTLWGGKVVDELSANEEQTRGILLFNKLVREDARVKKIILPFRDGITLILKK